MKNFYKYPKILSVERRLAILAAAEVVATEKIHGTNFRVGFPAGATGIAEIHLGGRNESFGTDGGERFYKGRPVAWFRSRPELLERLLEAVRARTDGEVVLYGEICGAGIQKGVRYRDDDELSFRAFDLRLGEDLVSHDDFVAFCESTGLPRVPELWRGAPTLEALDALLEKVSVEGLRHGVRDESNLMEGVVVRAVPLAKDRHGEWLIAKHKCVRFQEEVKEKVKAQRVNLSPLRVFALHFVLPGRVENALGRLRDRGVELEGHMSDMRHLVPCVVEDLRVECASEWEALLAEGFSDKQIATAVSQTLAPLYRSSISGGAGEG